jgi:diguanylate cyclase (GGDEF)-like protein
MTDDVMNRAEGQAALAAMFEYLKNVLYDQDKAVLDPGSLPLDFRELAQGLLYIGSCIIEMRTLAWDVSRGQLDTSPASADNELARELKSLQATLRHLTWQIGQVAKGDYKQKVSFIGDFSDSINHMIHELYERDRALHEEIEINEKKSEQLRQNVSLFEAITENIAQWIIVIDSDSREWLYTNHEPVNMLHSLAYKESLIEWLHQQVELAQRTESHRVAEFSIKGENDHQYFSVARYPVAWLEHNSLAFVLTDITEERCAMEELETIAYYDALTGSYTRHFGMGLLDRWLANRETFIISFIDMDSLKFVNDTFGHNEGDDYILAVTRTLKCFKDEAIVSRLGGDEFMLLCKGMDKAGADARLEEIRADLAKSSDDRYQRSISYGTVEVCKDNDKTGSYLLSLADEIMYQYKRARKMERRPLD